MTAMDVALANGRHEESIDNGMAAWILRWLKRRNFNRMLLLDDRLLDDIGVTREEVEYASRLPLRVNAAIELRRLAHRRRAKARWR